LRWPFSIIASSWSEAPEAFQAWLEKRPDLYHEVIRTRKFAGAEESLLDDLVAHCLEDVEDDGASRVAGWGYVSAGFHTNFQDASGIE
jgi:hypothetical protein